MKRYSPTQTCRFLVARIERQRNPEANEQAPPSFPDVAAAPFGLRLLRWLALALEQRLRIASEPPDRAQRHVTDDACDSELWIIDQAVGEFLIARQVGADETRHIVDGAAHLPALDDLLDRGEPFLEIALTCLLLKDDFGEDRDGLRQPSDVD